MYIMKRKGIILAGGRGTRLHPATKVVCKQLLPIYDKPMVHYSLSTLMECGIRDILLICNPEDRKLFEKLLGTGSHLGISISYKVQDRPRGIADALRIGKSFLDGSPCALILGDNLFFSPNLSSMVENSPMEGATIFAYQVSNPESYGVVVLDKNGNAKTIVEKPTKRISDLAVTGFYLFDSNASSIAESLTPSARGELEITDVNAVYMKKKNLRVQRFGRGDAWLDTGTHDSLLSASEFVRTMQVRQGIILGSPEETALRKGFVDEAGFERITNVNFVPSVDASTVDNPKELWVQATDKQMGEELSVYKKLLDEDAIRV
jgi:glucose-1-phosphate thymidylyltransferase